MGPTEIEGEAVDPLIGWCLTYPINFSGHPAASVPAGMTDGLPVGMQVVARRGADGELLAACGAFERVRPWMETYQIWRTATVMVQLKLVAKHRLTGLPRPTERRS